MSTHTPEQIQTQAAFAAWLVGEPIEARRIAEPQTDWLKFIGSTPIWKDPDVLYRPAPVPAPRYWSEPAHVPGPVCWLREREGSQWLIICLCVSGVHISADFPRVGLREWSRIKDYEYSTDRFVWKPCLVQP